MYISGGIGLLCVLSRMVTIATETKEEEVAEILLGAVDQIITWKEENDDLFIYSR